MSNTTPKSFTYRLFHAIRSNKKALLAELARVAEATGGDAAQRDTLRLVLNAMFRFEMYARGAQKALAGERDAKYFTPKARNADHPHVCFLNFSQHASWRAHKIVELMLNCQSLLVGPTWQAILSIEGMNNAGFRDVLQPHVRDRIAGLVTAVRQRSDAGFSAAFTDLNFLKMEFRNGAAVKKVEQHFPLPNVEGETLEEQIVRVNAYWTLVKHVAREAAKDPANWPSLDDSRNEEVGTIKALLAQFHRGLRPEQKALFRKYPDEVKAFFSHTL